MADTKITALTAITTVDPAADVLPIVDVSDTSMAASGTTKKITSNQILGAGGTATLASATISGALTVGTGANAAVLKASFLGGYSVFENSAGTGNPSITFNNDLDTGIRAPSANTLVFDAGGFEQYRIASSGVFTWSDGAGGTRMTLNSTGLGVGISSPFADAGYKSIDLRGTTGGEVVLGSSSVREATITADGTNGMILNTVNSTPLRFYTQGGEKMRLDVAGNVGIGVTPSASWASNRRALQIGGLASGAVALNGTGGSGEIFFNSFFNTSTQNICVVTGGTGKYDFNVSTVGAHSWSVGTGTAGNVFTFTQAMTLESTGSLVLGAAAVATTATDGFLYIPGCAGTPTGTPTAKTGRVPLVVDTTNNKLYFYSGGAWVAAN